MTTRAATVHASNLSQGEIEAIRHNWDVMGFAHWFNDYGTEYWKHPETGESVSFYEWS